MIHSWQRWQDLLVRIHLLTKKKKKDGKIYVFHTSNLSSIENVSNLSFPQYLLKSVCICVFEAASQQLNNLVW